MPSRSSVASLLAAVLLTLGMALAVALCAPAPAQARAASCSASVGSGNLGSTISPLTTTTVETSVTLNFSCTGLLPYASVTLCPNLSAGSGGDNGGGLRQLAGPSSATTTFQLYQDSGRTTSWGSAGFLQFGAAPTITVSANSSGAASTSRTMYARAWISSGLTVGSYSTTFSGESFIWGLNLLSCAGITVGYVITPAPFTFTATLTADCGTLTSSTLNFGTVGVLSAPVSGQSNISVTCAKGAPYSISLDDGQNASGVGARRLRKGSEHVSYGIFRDNARTQAWSGTGSAATGTGTGSTQNFPVYGKVAPQSTPSPGSYADSVIATITY